MTKTYQWLVLKNKTILTNMLNGAKSTLPAGFTIMTRVITLPDGTTVYTAFEFIGETRCYVLTRTIRNGVIIPNLKIRNESEEIIKDRASGLFKYK